MVVTRSLVVLALVGSLATGAALSARAAARGYLGVALSPAEVPELPEGSGGPWETAGQVVYLVPNATADRAGIELGDLVLAIDGVAFTKENGGPREQLRAALKDKVRGDRVLLTMVKTGVDTQVSLGGEPSTDPLELVYDLPARLDALEPGGSLVLTAGRGARVVELEVELGPHPHDVPRERPALDDAQAFGRLLGEPNELERFGRAAIERFGLAEDTADLRKRLAAIHESDDGFRLDAVGFVHRNPWRIEEASRDLLGELAPPGGRPQLARRLRASAALQRGSLAGLEFEPLPRGVSAEEHADALERVLTETAKLVGEAFVGVDEEDEAFLVEHWPDLAAGLEEGIYLHADSNRARARRNLRLLEIARLVDLEKLHAAALSWSRLADPDWLAALEQDLGEDEKADEAEILKRETFFGDIVFGGRARNTWRGRDFAVLVDLGGDDRHQNAAGSSRGAERPVSAVIDLAGDDAWEATFDAAQGAGLMGVGLLVDVRGNDRYVAKDWAQGAGLLGIGMLIDGSGDDRFRAGKLVQGAGAWGAGLLLDLGGNDLREAVVFSQGFGLPGAVGLVHDAGGNDAAWAKGGPPTGYGTPGVFDAWSQGCGMGLRWLQSGGVGVHVDDSGADDYEAGNFSQGGGYYLGWGLMQDRGRSDDVYVGSRYDQGFSAHQAIGTFLEEGGDDRYETRNAVNAGLAWDECVTLFRDSGGDDVYRVGGFSIGASAHNSFCFFVDESGSDSYEGQAPGRAGGNDYHGGTSLSLFLDLGPGQDRYESGLAPGEIRVGPEHGIRADIPTRLFRHPDADKLEARRAE